MYNSKESQFMSGSNPLNPQDSTKNIMQSENQSVNSKTVTRFPPILKNKTDQTPNLKENCKEGIITSNANNKKIHQDPAINSFKKMNTQVKKKGGKKQKIAQIKPQILQKYKQYGQFLELVNFSNNLKVSITQKQNNYVLYTGKGNNSGLIKTIFRNYRPWWTIQENNPDNPHINLFWYQLRQNQILDNFKENIKTEHDFQSCNFYLQDGEDRVSIKEITQQKRQKEKDKHASTQSFKTQNLRSQSVTQKDIRSTNKLGLTKRSSSRTKGVSTQKQSIIQHNLTNLGKHAKDEQQEGQVKKKKVLANPKMWPIYNNYKKIFSYKDLKQLKKLKVITEQGKIEAKISRFKVKSYQNRSNYFKIHNHLTNNWNLSNKKALFMNLKNYYDAQKINPFDFIPMTFHVTQLDDKQFKKFEEQYQHRAQNIKQQQKKAKNQQLKYGFKPKKRNAWLVKPGQNTNRGTGIQVVESLQEIKEIILRDKTDKMGRPRTHILQEYIMPFLYQKRKFDIRSYICVTSINGYQKGYWFQDGYIRTATKEFTMKNLGNKFIHLTNDAVQKYHEDYGKFQPANKLSFADFQRYLDTNFNSNNENGTKLKFYQQAYPQMKKLAGDAIRSVYTKMNPNKKEFSFEIFGLDFMIDQNFKVWLIQANTNPCLELACPLLGKVIPSMLQNAFKIVIDPLFPPPPVEDLVLMSKKMVLPEHPIQNNKFELIFDQVQQQKHLKALLTNAPDVKIFQVQQEQQQEYDQNFNQCGIKENE